MTWKPSPEYEVGCPVVKQYYGFTATAVVDDWLRELNAIPGITAGPADETQRGDRGEVASIWIEKEATYDTAREHLDARVLLWATRSIDAAVRQVAQILTTE
jgi:hypothetical protein